MTSLSKDVGQVIEELGDLARNTWKNKENPELLSKDLHDIAVLNWALGQYQASFEEQERTKKTELDLSRANLLEEFVNKGDAVNRAEIKATIQLATQRKDYNKVASALEKTKIVMRANDKVMDSARSRLALIRKEV